MQPAPLLIYVLTLWVTHSIGTDNHDNLSKPVTKAHPHANCKTQVILKGEMQTQEGSALCLDNPCILITGDTQYPRTPTSGDNPSEAKAQLLTYFNAIDDFAKDKGAQFLGMIINGDITEYGHPGERSVMDDFFNNVSFNIWYGLGNHDYGYEKDCWMERCNTGPLQSLVDDVISKHDNIIASDYLIKDINEFPTIVRHFKGSFAYSFRLAGIRFIQLNSSDQYNFKIRDVFDASIARDVELDIQPSLAFAKKQLEAAYEAGEPSILLSHYSHLSNFTEGHAARNLASAHFFGHWHGDPRQVIEACGSLTYDRFLSGTGFEGSGLLLEIDKTNKQLKVYAFHNNNLDHFTLLTTTALRTANEE